jgi:hypothetical protein
MEELDGELFHKAKQKTIKSERKELLFDQSLDTWKPRRWNQASTGLNSLFIVLQKNKTMRR